MLDGPGDLRKIQPRKSRQSTQRRSSWRVPLDQFDPTKGFRQKVLLTLLVTLGAVAMLLVKIDGTPLLAYAIAIAMIPLGAAVFYWLLRQRFAFRTSRTSVLNMMRHFLRERREAEWQRQHAQAHHEKKVNRVVHRIDDGADYKVGADGELVIVKKHQEEMEQDDLSVDEQPGDANESTTRRASSQK